MGRYVDSDGFTLDDYDFLTGQSKWSKIEPDGTITFRTDIPTENIIRANAENRLDTAGTKFGNDWCKIGEIPMNLWFDSGMDEADLQDDTAFMRRWMREHSAFMSRDSIGI